MNIKKILTLTIATLPGIRTFLIGASSAVLAQSKLNEADFRIKESDQGWKALINCRGKKLERLKSYLLLSHAVEDITEAMNDT